MLQQESRLKVADNTGAREVLIIRVLRGKKHASVGDLVVVTVKKSLASSSVKRGEIFKALIVRTKSKINRGDGSYICFDDNACVLLENNDVKGTRIFGPVPKELKKSKFKKITSMANEII